MSKEIKQIELPIVALRGLVIFPGMLLHFDISRKKSVAALQAAMTGEQEIFLITQKDVRIDEPELTDLYKTGVIANIKQVVRLPSGENIRVVVEGGRRAQIAELIQEKPFLNAFIKEQTDKKISKSNAEYTVALIRHAKDLFENYLDVAPKMSPDVLLSVIADEDPSSLADYIASVLTIDYEDKQIILDELNPLKRIEKLCGLLERETELLEIEENIASRVHDQVDKNQREYYLREQMKAISIELNEGEDTISEVEKYREKIDDLKDCSDEIKNKLLVECDRLAKMGSSSSAESTVVRGYLDACINLPWGVYTKDNLDLIKVKKKLDNDHYGMEKVKERIIEMLAVRRLSPDIKGQIICLAGPPGVGKTSIARSVAAAMGRKYTRISLGGIHDEAEIRGHRKTYIGSMPGRIISAITGAGTSNPLVLLDEIDKLDSDFKGDPASALLEVLDGEQNFAFVDHYLEIPFDLSKVLFITTANDKSTIPPALLDRMEVIDMYSYTHEEKFNIAKRHLIPKQLKAHGIKSSSLKISDEALHQIIEGYTREAGVRKLERQVANICRKAAVRIVNGESDKISVKPNMLEEFLGVVKYKPEKIFNDEVGVANGLAWTSVGGEMLQIEVAVFDGKGNVELTGSLGDVMKESAKAAISYIRSQASNLNIDKDFYKDKDIHIHVPEGAVPKDGPSAGITIATALASALSDIPIKGSVAMTGEVTLRGRVLPIGGLKEKSMAAYRAGIKTIIIPQDNVSDISEIDDVVKTTVEFVPAETLQQVWNTAFMTTPIKEVNIKEKALNKKGNSLGVSYEI